MLQIIQVTCVFNGAAVAVLCVYCQTSELVPSRNMREERSSRCGPTHAQPYLYVMSTESRHMTGVALPEPLSMRLKWSLRCSCVQWKPRVQRQSAGAWCGNLAQSGPLPPLRDGPKGPLNSGAILARGLILGQEPEGTKSPQHSNLPSSSSSSSSLRHLHRAIAVSSCPNGHEPEVSGAE